MLFSIHYVTRYDYSAPVTDNLNALRVRPTTTATQRCDEFIVRIDPETRLGRHSDYFGTEVIEFGISTPHSSLEIDVRARVVTSDPPDPPDPALGGAGGPAVPRGGRRVPAREHPRAAQRRARRAVGRRARTRARWRPRRRSAS